MTEQSGATRGPAEADDDRGGGWRRWSVLLPALTFLAGLLLGGAVIAATATDDGEERVAAAPTATPTVGSGQPQPTPTDLVVRVPGPCVQAAERAEVAYLILEEGVAAARDLDARRLAELVDRAQQERPEVEALVRQCQQATGDAIVNPAPTPVPTP